MTGVKRAAIASVLVVALATVAVLGFAIGVLK